MQAVTQFGKDVVETLGGFGKVGKHLARMGQAMGREAERDAMEAIGENIVGRAIAVDGGMEAMGAAAMDGGMALGALVPALDGI